MQKDRNGIVDMPDGEQAVYRRLMKPWSKVTVVMGLVAVMELGREVIVARLYGTSTVSDAFYLAIALPLMFSGTFQTVGVSVMVPWFCLSSGGDEQAAHLQMSHIFLLLLAPLGLLALSAAQLAHLLAPLLAGPAIDLDMLAQVLRFALPAIALSAQSATLAAYLNAREAYGAASMRSLVNAACFVGAMVLLKGLWGPARLGVAFLLGDTGEVLWLVAWTRPTLRRTRLDTLRAQWPQLWKLLRNSILPSVASVGVRVGLTAERMIAGYLTVGSVSALSYSRRITLGLGRVFGQGMNTIVRSKAARAYAEDSEQATQPILAQGFRLMSLVLVPIALFVIVLRVPIAQLLFANEQFDVATDVTAAMMGCFAAGYPAAGLVSLLLTAFEARGDTTTPSIQRLVILAVNLALDVALVRFGGVLGIAIAYAAADVIWLLWTGLSMQRQRVTRLVLWESGFLVPLALGGLAACVSFWGAFTLGRPVLPSDSLGLVFSIALSALTGGAAFAIVETVLGVEEFQLGLKWIRARWAAIVQ